jgi:hypothetical protein
MDFKRFYSEVQDTQVDFLHQDVSVHQPSALSDLLGGSTSMDVEVDMDLASSPSPRPQSGLALCLVLCGGRAKCLHESAAGAP